MLVLSRERGQSIYINGREISITVVSIGKDKVRLGIEAPPGMSVHREEVLRAIEEAGDPPDGS